MLLGYLPVTSNPDEEYSIEILSILYNIRQLYNTIGFWTLSFSDENNNNIVLGVKVVAGVNMLTQYPELPFNLMLESDSDPTRGSFNELFIGIYEK